MNGEDAQLVARAVGGDGDAFGQLVRRYKAMVHAYVLSRVRDFGWAEDLAQETFIAAFVGLPRLRHPAKFGVWLRAIADNLVAGWLRRTQREGRLCEQAASARQTAPAGRSGPVDLEEAVLAALSRLAPGSAAALTLYYCDGLSQRECAEFLGVSRKAVEGRLRRARQALRQEVIRMAEETLKRHSPDESFDQSVAEEVDKLVAVVGGPYKRGPVEQAEERLRVLFTRNEERLSDLIRHAGDTGQRRAAMRMVAALGAAGVNRALPLVLSADERVRNNALSALPTYGDGAFTYTVLEAVHESGFPDEQKVELLIRLIRRPTLVADFWPRHMRDRFAEDSTIYMEMLMQCESLAAGRLAEEVRRVVEQGRPIGTWLSRAFVRFGTEALSLVESWIDGDGKALAAAALELVGMAAQGGLRGRRRPPWGRAVSQGDLYLRVRGTTEPVVHPSRLDDRVMQRIGRKVVEAARAGSPAVRRAAAAAMGYFDDEQVLQPLRQVLSGEHAAAVAAARAVPWRPSPARVEVMVEVLESAARPVQAAADDALAAMWSQCHDLIEIRPSPRAKDPQRIQYTLARREQLEEVAAALDGRRERILAAVGKAGLSNRGTPWEWPLAKRIDLSLRERRQEVKPSELHRRAGQYWRKHPDQRYGRGGLFHVNLAAIARYLPEERDYHVKELTRLISFVNADYSTARRQLIDAGWMTRERDVYRFTELGRQAWRMEHLLAEHMPAAPKEYAWPLDADDPRHR